MLTIKMIYSIAVFLEMGLGFFLLTKLFPHFRSDHKKIRILAFSLLGVAELLYGWNAWLFYVSTSFVIVSSIMNGLLFWVFWKSRYLEVVLFQTFYQIGISLLKIPVLTLKGILLQENIYHVNRAPKDIWQATYIYLIVLAIYLLQRNNSMIEVTLKQLIFKNKILCALIIAFEWMMLCYCMKIGVSKFEIANLILNLIIILCVSMLMFVIALAYVYQQISNEKLLQQEKFEHLKSQYHGLQELYETNRRWVHDAKHELLYIGSCLEENNVAGANESLQNYLRKIKQIEKKVWSGFSFLDFMLNYKKLEMDKKGIRFTLDTDLQNITISEEDLMIILGNLLDNAMEAAQKCAAPKRYMKLKICNINNMLLLNIENSSDEVPIVKNGKFVSSKHEPGVHGMGIESVQKIVEKYEGEIEFQYAKEYFQVQILI